MLKFAFWTMPLQTLKKSTYNQKNIQAIIIYLLSQYLLIFKERVSLVQSQSIETSKKIHFIELCYELLTHIDIKHLHQSHSS